MFNWTLKKILNYSIDTTHTNYNTSFDIITLLKPSMSDMYFARSQPQQKISYPKVDTYTRTPKIVNFNLTLMQYQ